MQNIKMIAVAVALAGMSGLVSAQTSGTASTPRIDQRQENQDKRIDQGVASGALNQKETARLEKGQARVQRKEDRAMADSTVTAKERRHIERAQDKQSKKIYREKHDKQVVK